MNTNKVQDLLTSLLYDHHLRNRFESDRGSVLEEYGVAGPDESFLASLDIDTLAAARESIKNLSTNNVLGSKTITIE